jgi:hypothetical protein
MVHGLTLPQEPPSEELKAPDWWALACWHEGNPDRQALEAEKRVAASRTLGNRRNKSGPEEKSAPGEAT